MLTGLVVEGPRHKISTSDAHNGLLEEECLLRHSYWSCHQAEGEEENPNQEVAEEELRQTGEVAGV